MSEADAAPSIDRLDHLVLTVADIEAPVAFSSRTFLGRSLVEY